VQALRACAVALLWLFQVCRGVGGLLLRCFVFVHFFRGSLSACAAGAVRFSCCLHFFLKLEKTERQ
jgi:hypothetical protein